MLKIENFLLLPPIPKLQVKSLNALPKTRQFALLNPDNEENSRSKFFSNQVKKTKKFRFFYGIEVFLSQIYL